MRRTSVHHGIPFYLLPEFLKRGLREVRRKDIEDELGVAFTHAVSRLEPAQIDLAGARRMRMRRLTHCAEISVSPGDGRARLL